jgi:large subunit ribosomal protein L33
MWFLPERRQSVDWLMWRKLPACDFPHSASWKLTPLERVIGPVAINPVSDLPQTVHSIKIGDLYFLTSEGAGMAKSKKKSETVFLVCEETGDYNYAIRKKPGGEKLKLKKYSPRLRKHTVHNEKKK